MDREKRLQIFKFDMRSNAIKFVSYLLICMLAFFSMIFIIEQKDVRTQRLILSENENGMVEIQKNMIGAKLEGVVADLMYIESSWVMQEFFADSTRRTALEKEMLVFSEKERIYDQIRFIDIEGDEIVRINYQGGKPAAVGERDLQNKKDRYYFKKSVELEKNQVYVSLMDLNVENGSIEIPIKPMIRFAVPSFDSNGQKRGVVILNYLAQDILSDYEDTISKSMGRSFLLDDMGYWVASYDREKMWGFMYEDKTDVSFSNEFKAEWDTIGSRESGQFYSEKGFFTFDTVYAGESRCWKIVSYVPVKGAAYSEYAIENELLVVAHMIANKKSVLAFVMMVSLLIAALYLKNRIAEDAIRIHATYDGLTGVYNRGTGMKLLSESMKTAKMKGEPLSICFVDINGLKSVNDILGHEKGDELIRTAADVFSSNIRNSGFTARWGGDEFLLVFPNASSQTVEYVWNRIVEEIQAINDSEDRDYIISASHGVQEFNMRESHEIDTLVKSADEKMYEEKAVIKRDLNVIRRNPMQPANPRINLIL